NRAFRPRHELDRRNGRTPDAKRRLALGCRRRRYGCGAEACGGGKRLQLRFDRRRRLPGMVRGKVAARRRGFAGEMSGIGQVVTLSPRDYDAVLFDLDGVLTDTASVHAAAWKRLFDEFLQRRAALSGESFVP